MAAKKKSLTKRKRAIKQIENLEKKLIANVKTINMIDHVIDETTISWELTYPEIFPDGHNIMTRYGHIGLPEENISKENAVEWLSKALALTSYSKDHLNGLTDEEFESAGLHIYRKNSPAVEIIKKLNKYDNRKSKKLYNFLIEIAREGEKCSSIDCNIACAFCLRKILEEAIKKKIIMEYGHNSIDNLKPMINKLQPILGKRRHKEILSIKFLMEESIHDDYNPTTLELITTVASIFRVIDKLEVFDRKERGDRT